MRSIVKTEKAPTPIGMYSLAIIAACEKLVFTSGKIPVDPETNEVVQGDIRAQTRQSMINLQETLRAAGTDLENLVKVTIFMSDINNFAAINEVYKEFITADPPARTAVQVAALPKGVGIEIEGIAIVP